MSEATNAVRDNLNMVKGVLDDTLVIVQGIADAGTPATPLPVVPIPPTPSQDAQTDADDAALDAAEQQDETPVPDPVPIPNGGSVEGQSKRKALIVGINAYPGNELQGCVNDGKQDLLEITTNYGFIATQVRAIFDERATTAAIMERLLWLCDGARPGDVLFFAYSGHGAQVPCRNTSGETDGLSEVICPVDFDWTLERMIIDKQFVSIFSKLPKGVKLFWLSDSCHAGSLDRNMSRKNKRMVRKEFPMPPDIAWSVNAAKRAGFKPRSIKGLVGNPLFDVAYIPGCLENQTSADSSMNGVPCGAATYYFWRAAHKLGKAATVKAITDAARSELAIDNYEQQPYADGSLSDGPWLQ